MHLVKTTKKRNRLDVSMYQQYDRLGGPAIPIEVTVKGQGHITKQIGQGHVVSN